MDRQDHLASHHVTQAAHERLRKSLYLSIRNVSCEYDDGRLLLRGQLPNFYHKQMAQVAVAGLEGVTQVANATEVMPSLL